jgi:NADPH:quinone reductase
MTDAVPAHALQLFSTVTDDGRLELALREVPVPSPEGDGVLIRVEASPINPSDLGVVLAGADGSAFTAVDGALPAAAAPLPDAARRAMAARVGKAFPIGNEGAGVVVKAGDDPAAQALLGKTVSLVGGGLYAQYRLARARDCLVLDEGTSAEEGASSFVNPMTALGFLETMRLEGFGALIHTAAASNLGQMLVKLCRDEGVALVNIVRSDEQVELLRSLGAEHVLNARAPDFIAQLIEAIAVTGAYLAFDATGGGKLANQILIAMEQAALRTSPAFGAYGSTQKKQVYLFGRLETAPTELTYGYGMKWSVGGWLVSYVLEQIGPERTAELRRKVAAEIGTTFASRYTQRITLDQAVQPDTIAAYNRKATGEKYLITPHG